MNTPEEELPILKVISVLLFTFTEVQSTMEDITVKARFLESALAKQKRTHYAMTRSRTEETITYHAFFENDIQEVR